MATLAQATRFELDRRELLTLADARGDLLSCRSGEVWITFDGDRRDLILGPGDSCRIATAARVVVSAILPARLDLVPSGH